VRWWQVKLVSFAVLVAAASAFAPAPFGARTHVATRLFSDVGKYDGKLWDNEGTSLSGRERDRSIASSVTSALSSIGSRPRHSSSCPLLTLFFSPSPCFACFHRTAKKAVYAEWNPAAPRSALNFNPFETFEGNSPDCSGYYPGEVRHRSLRRPWPADADRVWPPVSHTRLHSLSPSLFSMNKQGRYKDPLRGDVNFQSMMAERAEAEERNANPKPGSAPGCPGCRT
jgi:hypothetical protein